MPRSSGRVRRLVRSEWPFLVALGLAAALRVVVQVAFPPAFVFSDGPTYLGFVDHLVPSPERPLGYGILLWALAAVSRAVALVASFQAVLGLATAVLLYAVLRRWGVSRWVATLACLPVLFDQMQLSLEHSVLSDVLFVFLVVVAVALVAWWRPPPLLATAAGGLVLGLAVLVRVVGEPTVLVVAVFCVVVVSTMRARLLHVMVLIVAFVAPLTAYAAWYHAENGAWAISQSSGRFLYMRTTTFVDCSRLSLPDYERPLCPEEPVGQRLDPTEYGWHSDAVHDLQPPAGVTADEAMHDFAVRAIRAQPWDYARVVVRDALLSFWPSREDVYEYDTAHKWQFETYLDLEPTSWTGPAYLAHGGQLLEPREPLATAVARYGQYAYLPGPVLLVLLVLALAGLVVRRPPGAPKTRPLTFLLLALGVGLTLAPDVTVEFVWRYQLPAIVLVPAAAALAWTRLRWRPAVAADSGADPEAEPSGQAASRESGSISASGSAADRPNSRSSRTNRRTNIATYTPK